MTMARRMFVICQLMKPEASIDTRDDVITTKTDAAA